MDIYEEITERILSKLEKGIIPWKHYLKGADGASLYPVNSMSGKEYRGVNRWLLSEDYPSNRWGTYKQLSALGKQVKKGEKGTGIVFWKILEKEKCEGEKNEKFPIIRRSVVFNEAQCDGFVAQAERLETENDPVQNLEVAEGLISNFPLGFPKAEPTQKSSAFYRPGTDQIFMPDRGRFVSSEHWYSVYFHESIHATGHKTRLARELGSFAAFGEEGYSKEELVAELGASYLCSKSGILEATIENAVAYLSNWMARLRGDKKFFMQASGLAQRATDYLLGVTFDKKEA